MPNTSKQVIILGRGRSGSSVMGQVLTELGFNLGNSRPATPNNPRGYFEDKEFNIIVDDYLPQDVHYQTHEILDKHPEFERRFQDYVRRHNHQKLWGFKDGSGIYLMPIISRNLDNPYFIVARRNIESQAKSIQAALSAGQKTIEQCKQSIENYYYKLELFFKFNDYPRLDIWYEDLIEQPQTEAKKIAKFLGVPYKKIEGVRPEMKHY